jgi:hypothetical protein
MAYAKVEAGIGVYHCSAQAMEPEGWTGKVVHVAHLPARSVDTILNINSPIFDNEKAALDFAIAWAMKHGGVEVGY